MKETHTSTRHQQFKTIVLVDHKERRNANIVSSRLDGNDYILALSPQTTSGSAYLACLDSRTFLPSIGP
jgi:hypothetical protein